MLNIKKIKKQRERRKKRVRGAIKVAPDRPMLSVYISNKHIYAQIIDVYEGKTLVYSSTLDKDFPIKDENRANKKCARIVGERLAKKALEKGINKVVLNRGYKKYHGRIKELCEAAREVGLKF